MYNWELPDWPNFTYQLSDIEDILFSISEETGHITGMLKALPETLQTEALLNVMVVEAIKTSAIEGEYLSRPDVLSSIKINLGLSDNKKSIKDKKAHGAGELMVTVRKTYADIFTKEMLFKWHEVLLNQSKRIKVGNWRSHNEPMQVVSGAIGYEKVHFVAPPSNRVPKEMARFIKWFNDTGPGGPAEIKKAPVRSAIAHLYFETIHPFEDGNGRIGRAIAEKALSQTIGRPVMMSLSQVIEADRKTYYNELKKAQKKNEITDWITYFVRVIYQAQINTRKLIDFTLRKTKFVDYYKQSLNDRQLKVVLRMLQSPDGFEGGMTAKKYTSIAKTSKATATRDLQLLAEMGALCPEGAGRSVHYVLNF